MTVLATDYTNPAWFDVMVAIYQQCGVRDPVLEAARLEQMLIDAGRADKTPNPHS